jgi:hypothetical protein
VPIGKDEWNSGSKSDTFETQILSFLRSRQDCAFTLSEIVAGLGYHIEIRDFGSFIGGVAGYWVFQNAVENLVKDGTVESRKIKQTIGEQTYYKAT